MIHRIGIAGYRSIRSLFVRLEHLNVVTGPNGCGKSNLYRALRLMADIANGNLAGSLAREGGFLSVHWAGPETISNEMRRGDVPVEGLVRKKPYSLKLGISAEPLSYCIDLGLPRPSNSMFDRDPEVKRECLWTGLAMDTRSLCADRRNASLRCRHGKGSWQDIDLAIASSASFLTEYSDPFAAPEIIVMREQIRAWRFYDTLRCDPRAPARLPSIQTFTPVMSGDGADLAAAIQTILEIGDRDRLAFAVDSAFPGSQVSVRDTDSGMWLLLSQPGMLRELRASELSDGTLRYLMLVAALLSPRPPELLVLNEPESSLHPELIIPLANMIRMASENSQVIVVSHNETLVSALEADEGCKSIRLTKDLGETKLVGSNLLDQHGWQWPKR